jgi:hypothetical protein
MAVHHAGTKLSSNLQSQKYENHPESFGARFGRDYENSPPRRSVKREERFFWENVSKCCSANNFWVLAL